VDRWFNGILFLSGVRELARGKNCSLLLYSLES
jgi:hypothetical protein